MDDVGVGGDPAAIEGDPVRLDALYAARPDHVLDPSEGIDLARAEHRHPVHLRPSRGVDPGDASRRLEPVEEVADVLGLRGRLRIRGDARHILADQIQRLIVAPMVEPVVAEADPADSIRRDVVAKQPRGRPLLPDSINPPDEPDRRGAGLQRAEFVQPLGEVMVPGF